MTTAAKFGFPQGSPLFDVSFRAISEAFAGNGILASGDFAITEGTADMDLDVAAGTAWYNGSEYSEGTVTTLTVAAADATNDRWDTVVYDTAATTPAPTIRTGTAGATPEPPDLQAGDLLLGYAYVPAGATDVPSANIYEWRATASRAADINVGDSPGLYATDTVESALTSELQYAAQLTGYPVPNADILNSTVTVNAGTGLTTTNAAIGLGGSSTLSVAAGGISSTEIADATIATADLAASAVTTAKVADGTILDADIDAATTIARGKLDDTRTLTTQTASGTNAGYTTADEELVLVDTATNATAYTVTLASADATAGNVIQVLDVGGGAKANPITLDTAGTETIDGAASMTVDSDYGGTAVVSDGTNWFTAGGGGGGGGYDRTADVDASGSRNGLAAGNQAVVVIDALADGETLEIVKGSLTSPVGAAVPTGVNLIIATLDGTGGFTSQTTLIAGDGATVFADETGNPLGSYTNASGASQTVAVLVDNTTTAAEDVYGAAKGEVF